MNNSKEIQFVKSIEAMPDFVRKKLINANVFFSDEYYNYTQISNEEMIYIYNDEYVIPICVYNKLFLKYAMFVSEPFRYKPYADTLKYEECTNEEKFLNQIIATLKKTKIAWISTSASSLFNSYPDDSVRIPFGSHIVDLTLSEDELWSNVHSKHRNSIRRAEKGEVEVRFGGKELIDDYIKLDKETWARSGKDSYGINFFKKIADGLDKNAQIVVAYKNNQPQAGGVFFKNKQMSYYMYGTSADHPEPGSANLLQWKTMLRFKNEGVQKYSFVGCRINEDEDSKYHNIQRFKERFGGELIQGFMFRSVIHPIMRRAFMALYKLKNQKEMVDVIDTELPKWSELNER